MRIGTAIAALATLMASASNAQTRVDYQTASDWGTGFQAQITIYNDGSQPIEGWMLSFDLAVAIGSVWNASVVSQQDVHYVIQSAGWNAEIPAGGSVIFGFIGSPGNVTTGPTGFQVSSNGTAPPYTPPPSTPTSTTVSLTNAKDTDTQITIPQGASTYSLSLTGVSSPVFTVGTNNTSAIGTSLAGSVLTISGLSAGRAGLRIEEVTTHTVRYVGVRVQNADGTTPRLPSYLAVGSVSEDTTGDLNFWSQFATDTTNRRMDIRYIYLNGGPQNGWATWTNSLGDRATQYIRNSRRFGIIPFFVFYNIPDASEGFAIDLQHAQDASYIAAYFQNLALALRLINQESPDDPVGMILEPDFLGYLAQGASGSPSSIVAATHAAYDSGVLAAGADPAFPDTIAGLVNAINYTIAKQSPQVIFGWQVNLWASPAGGWTTPIPYKGLIHLTDQTGITAGRNAIGTEASAIADYYVKAGITNYGASFVSVDKYGLDAVGAEAGAAQNPAQSIWFWNNDLWQNYLLFVRSLKAVTGLPIVLWQMPVGHINSSQAVNPYDSSGVFPDLTDTIQHYEDSAPGFFLGDTFTSSDSRYTYFSTNLGGDPLVTNSPGAVTWGNHMQDAVSSGVVAILFGAGVGASTNGVGASPGDAYWWITKIQQYYLTPVPLR